jgi:hypothetical protein
MINFDEYALALVKEDTVLFSSKKSGLRPLIECIRSCKGKHNNCVLYDRVTGLAAAKLVVYSDMISSVITGVASLPAKEHLKQHSIHCVAHHTVKNIMNKENTDMCPMEQKALLVNDNAEFFTELNSVIK